MSYIFLNFLTACQPSGRAVMMNPLATLMKNGQRHADSAPPAARKRGSGATTGTRPKVQRSSKGNDRNGGVGKDVGQTGVRGTTLADGEGMLARCPVCERRVRTTPDTIHVNTCTLAHVHPHTTHSHSHPHTRPQCRCACSPHSVTHTLTIHACHTVSCRYLEVKSTSTSTVILSQVRTTLRRLRRRLNLSHAVRHRLWPIQKTVVLPTK